VDHRRRRRLLLGLALILFLIHTVGQLLSDGGEVRMPAVQTPVAPRIDVSAPSWPQQGQAALLLGNGRPVASPGEQPTPIASLAKVMTAYLVLRRYPLIGAQDGFTVTVSADEANRVARDRA
jgi:hypothetical protein